MRKIAVPVALAVSMVLGLQGVAQAVVLVHTQVSASVSATVVPPGTVVTVSGTLSAGRRFHCFARRHIGVFQNHVFIGRATTDQFGHYSFPATVTTNSLFFVRFKGFNFLHHPDRVICLASRSNRAVVQVS